jgi:CheY-like chemotaxis protein
MSEKQQHRDPVEQALPPYLSDKGQKVAVGDEIRPRHLPGNEGATWVGPLNGRVLLVDDEPLIRKSLSRQLVAAGYVVRVAEDGLEAIGKLRAGHIDVIVSDLNMPRMSGVEFLNIIRKRFPQIPVILISAVVADEIPAGAAFDAYCHKTEFLSEHLLRTISDLAGKPTLRTAPPAIDNEAVQARWDGKGCYIVGCEDCLRDFSVPRVFHMGRGAKVTICVHCGKFVRFLVAEDSQAS